MRGRALGRGRLVRRRNKSGVVYVGDWSDSSGRRRREVLSTDRRVAERMLSDIIRRRDLEMAGLDVEDAQSTPLVELKEAYLAELATRVTERHLENSKARLSRVLKGVNAQTVADLAPQDVQAWRRERVADGASNRTANLDVNSLRSMLRWALQAEIIGRDPLSTVKPLPEGKRNQRYLRRSLSEDEVARFLLQARVDDQEEAARMQAERSKAGGTKGKKWAGRERLHRVPQVPLWNAFLETGARWGALTRVTWADLDESAGTLRLRVENAKGGHEQLIPLREQLIELLGELREHHVQALGEEPADSAHIFLTPRGEHWPTATRNAMRILDRVLEAAGIDKVDDAGRKLDIHALRHTFGTRLLRAGVGLHQVQRLLGHSSPALTAQVYAHLGSDDLRKAVEQLPRVGPGGRGGASRPRLSGTKLAQAKGGLGRVARKSLEEMERVIGIEPTTFSLGS